MSAITGIFNLNGRPVEREQLIRMIEVLSHRGPHGSNFWHRGSVGLAHRLLRVQTDPFCDEYLLIAPDAQLVLVADARIDNRQELLATLDLHNRSPEPLTDSELILEAYKKWGEECPKQLLGDYSFVIWNEREQSLFCARDPLGVKPFYYHFSKDFFAFASEIKALFSLSKVSQRLNEVRLADYLTSCSHDTEATFYKDIFRLPAAHHMTIGTKGKRLQRYWSFDPKSELKLGSNEAYAEEFRSIFAEAVRCRISRSSSVGYLLSGGLDSSSIACMAEKLPAERKGHRVRTFSLIFDKASKCDEREFIGEILDQKPFRYHYVPGDQSGPLEDMEQILWYQDEPFFAPGLYKSWKLFKAIEQQQIHVILDGHGGDETVSHGIGYLTELAHKGKWITLASEARGAAKTYEMPFREVFWAYVKRHALQPLLSHSTVCKALRTTLQSLGALNGDSGTTSIYSPTRQGILNPDFARSIHYTEHRKALYDAHSQPLLTERDHHYQTLIAGFQSQALEVLDRAYGAFAIEPRYPFLDRRLMEFCLALPPEQKLHGGWTRMILRRAMADILPEKVRWRTSKTDFLPTLVRGLTQHERGYLDEVIVDKGNLLKEYVDLKVVHNTYQRFLSGDLKDPEVVYTICKIVSLALWLKPMRQSTFGKERR